MALKIGMYVGAWPQNIGNAFFDFGAMTVMRAAFPDAELFPMGGSVHWMFNQGKNTSRNFFQRIINKEFVSPHKDNSIEIGQFAEVDLIVFAGMSLCDEFVINNSKTFIDASRRGVAILGLGAGAFHYTEAEANSFFEFSRQLKRFAVLTRDQDTYEMFNGRILNIKSGIDCAFFLSDFYTPPRLSLPPYNVHTFDAKITSLSNGQSERLVINTHHDCWGPLPDFYTSKPNTLVSDVPHDYLTLYAQAEETHSDRVHACVAALSYGNKARLYSNTPRKALFERVGVPNISETMSVVDMDLLNNLKDIQISLTRHLVNSILQ